MIHATGLPPTSPARWLASLGLFSALASRDRSARAVWRHHGLAVIGDEKADETLRWLAASWAPRGIVAPWCALPKDAVIAGAAIAESTDPRLAGMRAALSAAATVPAELEDRVEVMRRARAALPDESLDWMDAAVVLRDDGPAFAPVLGEGGAQARDLRVAAHYARHLARVMCLEKGWTPARSRAALRAAVSGTPSKGAAVEAPWGHLDGRRTVNPWEFVFAMEGVTLLAPRTGLALDASAPMSWPSQWWGRMIELPVPAGEDAHGGLVASTWEVSLSIDEVRELLAPAPTWRDVVRAPHAWVWLERNGHQWLPVSLARGPVESSFAVEGEQLSALRVSTRHEWVAIVSEALTATSAAGGGKADAAALLGVSAATLYHWLKEPDLASIAAQLVWPRSGAAGHRQRE